MLLDERLYFDPQSGIDGLVAVAVAMVACVIVCDGGVKQAMEAWAGRKIGKKKARLLGGLLVMLGYWLDHFIKS